MKRIIVQEQIKMKRRLLSEVGDAILALAKGYHADMDTQSTLVRQIEHFADKFLFVIIGEVNAGKSSFVNALLDAPICATSHDICTQEVQKIEYGEVEETIREKDLPLVTRSFPAQILRDITIVDTPGTNSRELDHQLITEDFIPLCNLVVFIFQVDTIHVQSAWDLFRKIKDVWKKKVIFVMTKADRYSQEEIKNYSGTLRKYALDEGLTDPLIFPTSAKLEMDGVHEGSGFESVRAYINDEVLGHAALAKVSDDAQVLKKLLGDIDLEFDLRESKLNQDIETRRKIDELIKEKEALAFGNISQLADRCTRAYDDQTDDTIQQLRQGIGFLKLTLKSVRSIFGGESTKSWLENLSKNHVEELNQETNRILQDGVDAIKSDITYMVVGVKNELDALKHNDVQPFEMFRELDAERTELLKDLRTNLTDFIEKSPIFSGEAVLDEKGVDYSGVQVAGGIAAIGTAIAVISQASVVDMTGGVATALGLLVAGGIAATRKGKYLRNVREALDDRKQVFRNDLEHNLSSYIAKIKSSIGEQFVAFDRHIQKEKDTIDSYRKESKAINSEIEQII